MLDACLPNVNNNNKETVIFQDQFFLRKNCFATWHGIKRHKEKIGFFGFKGITNSRFSNTETTVTVTQLKSR